MKSAVIVFILALVIVSTLMITTVNILTKDNDVLKNVNQTLDSKLGKGE